MLRLAWLAAAAGDDLRNAFPPESADRLYGWTATPGPRGAAEDAACFATVAWFQFRNWLRLELVDGRAQVQLARGTELIGFNITASHAKEIDNLKSLRRWR